MAALQIQTVFDAYKRYKKDISDISTELFIDWCNYLLQYYFHNIVYTSPDSLYATTAVNVTSATARYALPADFGGLKGFGDGLYPQDSSGQINENTALALTNFGSTQEGFYLDMTTNEIVFTPKPTKTIIYQLKYTPAIPVFDAYTDYFTLDKSETGVIILDSQFRLHILRAIDVFYAQWDEDPGAESVADFRYVRELNDIFENIRYTPSVFTLPSPSNPF